MKTFVHSGKAVFLFILIIMSLGFFSGGVSRQKTIVTWPDGIKDMDGNDLSTSYQSDSTVVFFAFDPELTVHKRFAVFLNALAAKYRVNGLRVVGISVKNIDVTRAYRNLSPLSFPLIVDQGEKLIKLFDWKPCCGGLALLKDEKILFFSATLITEESIRQLVEKSLFGKVSYDIPSVPPCSPEAMERKLRSTLFRKAYGDRRFSLEDICKSQKIVITFMSTLCSACQSGKRLAALRDVFNSSVNVKNRTAFVLVLSDPFTEQDLESLSAGMEIPFPVYFASGIFGPEEILITGPGKKIDPITMVFNEEGRLIFMETLGTSEAGIIEAIKQHIGLRIF